MSRKGISIIAGVIFLALTIAAAAIIYNAGIPIVQDLQVTAAVERMKTTLSELDSVIREVASEGQGSRRTIFISPEPGILAVNGSTDTISWTLETTAPSISPRTSQQFGNLITGANMDTSVEDGTYTRISPAVPAYIMSNAHLDVYINKTGSPASMTPLKTSVIVLAIHNKDTGMWLDNAGLLSVSIDGTADSGQGYTSAPATGTSLPFGQVDAFMDTTTITYKVSFILESGADFLTIEAEEV